MHDDEIRVDDDSSVEFEKCRKEIESLRKQIKERIAVWLSGGENMIAIGDTPFLNAISEGMKIIEKNGMYGIIGKETGKEILPALYDYLKPHGVS